jgi:hypothetical protein
MGRFHAKSCFRNATTLSQKLNPRLLDIAVPEPGLGNRGFESGGRIMVCCRIGLNAALAASKTSVNGKHNPVAQEVLSWREKTVDPVI